jgi:hypothetical protein
VIIARPSVRGRDDFAARLVAQLIERHVGRAPGGVGEPNVERRWNRVIPRIWRIMASGAGTVQDRDAEIVVQPLYTRDADRFGVEQGLAARNSPTSLDGPPVVIAPGRQVRPDVIEVEHDGLKGFPVL